MLNKRCKFFFLSIISHFVVTHETSCNVCNITYNFIFPYYVVGWFFFLFFLFNFFLLFHLQLVLSSQLYILSFRCRVHVSLSSSCFFCCCAYSFYIQFFHSIFHRNVMVEIYSRILCNYFTSMPNYTH